jgi:hypothetical protein
MGFTGLKKPSFREFREIRGVFYFGKYSSSAPGD